MTPKLLYRRTDYCAAHFRVPFPQGRGAASGAGHGSTPIPESRPTGTACLRIKCTGTARLSYRALLCIHVLLLYTALYCNQLYRSNHLI